MPGTHYRGRVKRALQFKNANLWGCFGGTTTPWPDDQNPPAYAPGDDDIAEPLLYVKIGTKSLCRPVTQQEWEALDPADRVPVPLNDIYYALVDDADAYAEYARWVYLYFRLDPTLGHPTGVFRILGVFSDLVPAAGYEGADYLLPANVESVGDIEWSGNYPTETIISGKAAAAYIPIEFR